MAKLSDLGEKEAIKRLSRFLPIGDDAACIPHKDGFLVLTTDVIYEKTHIPKEMTYEQIGKFIASVNISDIAAMGAKPIAFLLACGLPDMEIRDFEDITHAADRQCRKYGLELVGGDTKENSALTLAGFCLGTTKKPIMRSGAKTGDLLAVTGKLGEASLGFQMLSQGLEHPKKKKIVKKALEPEPRVKEGLILSKYATSMTDITDGLSTSVHDLSKSGKKGIIIESEKIPTTSIAKDISKSLGLDLKHHALHGGGDYELLFTINKKDWIKIEKQIKATVIGSVSGRGVRIKTNGKTTELRNLGYQHFKHG